ncbi:MAG: hypothetical protein U0401_20425 [Anaerolineae bacterium]
MDLTNLLRHRRSHLTKTGLNFFLRAALISMLLLLFKPGLSAADDLLKPEGSAATDISVWVPTGSATLPALMTADYLAPDKLPPNVKLPNGMVGDAFTFGIWEDQGVTQREFNPSIVINVKYRDEDVPEAIRPDEQRLHLQIYDSATRSWIKLCSSVNVHTNVVSAPLVTAIPFEGEGSSLLAIAVDPLPPPDQTVDGQGTTTLSFKRSNLRFQIPDDSVEQNAYFVITLLPNVTRSGSIKLLSRPVDIKACWSSPVKPDQDSRQLTGFVKQLQVGFDYDADTLARAGSKASLTVGNFQNGQWVDSEALGAKVVRGNGTVSVETGNLGSFGLATR